MDERPIPIVELRDDGRGAAQGDEVPRSLPANVVAPPVVPDGQRVPAKRLRGGGDAGERDRGGDLVDPEAEGG